MERLPVAAVSGEVRSARRSTASSPSMSWISQRNAQIPSSRRSRTIAASGNMREGCQPVCERLANFSLRGKPPRTNVRPVPLLHRGCSLARLEQDSAFKDHRPSEGLKMRIGLLAALSALLLAGTTATAADSTTACRSTVSGDLRLHTLESRIFGNTRTIRVLLPPGYEAPENAARRYPVLYLLDGQNLFDACLSDVSHQEWGVDETVYRLVAERKIPPLIVVGVDHAGKDRAHEYLPYK